jgi:hypothetical protein
MNRRDAAAAQFFLHGCHVGERDTISWIDEPLLEKIVSKIMKLESHDELLKVRGGFGDSEKIQHCLSRKRQRSRPGCANIADFSLSLSLSLPLSLSLSLSFSLVVATDSANHRITHWEYPPRQESPPHK